MIKNSVKWILFLIMSFLIVASCVSTKYVAVPLSDPPEKFKPNENIRNSKDLLLDYQEALFKIIEWNKWYEINTNIKIQKYTNSNFR